MGFFAIDRYSDDRNIFLVKFAARITERTCFFGSARGVVFGIKPKHDTFAAKVLQPDGFAVLIFGREIWCRVAFF